VGVVAGVGDRETRVVAERYSIASLRDAATRTSPPLLLTDQTKLLALVEVVEAAHVVDLEAAVERPSERSRARLYNALLRFDFGESA
jgi:hypothetical protein